MTDTPVSSPLNSIQNLIEVHDLCSITLYHYELYDEEHLPIIKTIKTNLRNIITVWLKDIETGLEQRNRKFTDRIAGVPIPLNQERLTHNETTAFDKVLSDCQVLLTFANPPAQLAMIYDIIKPLRQHYSHYLAYKNEVIATLLLNKAETDKELFILSEFTEV